MKFTTTCLAKNIDKTYNGFAGKADWNLYKCFVENEEGYGEFFINLNPITGKGEILKKRSDYGDFLLRELKKELR